MPIRQLVISALITTLLISPVLANEKAEQHKLNKIKQDIIKLEKSIKDSGEQQGPLNHALKKSELASAKLNRKINELEKTLRSLRSELDDLQQQQLKLEQSLKSQQGLIAQQITSAYKMGSEESIKLLLNQEDPETVSRTLKYYHYFLQARAKKLEEYRATLAALKQVESQIIDRQTQVTSNQSVLKDQQKQLLAKQQQRRDVLAKLINKLIVLNSA